MKRSLTILLAAAMLVGSIVFSRAQSAFPIYGRGVESCATWAMNRQSSYQSLMDQAWIEGYVSGAAFASAETPRPLKAIEANALQRLIDDFCAKNMLKELHEGAEALVSTLKTP
jgi:hypothetical protein